jgi:glycosyltransferase involved in cell wall biosynthesis
VRILMMSQFYAPVTGGQERSVENMSTALARRGHHVALASLWHEGRPSFEIDQGVRVHRVRGTFQRASGLFTDPQRTHLPPIGDPKVRRALAHVMEEEHPDIVHAHDWMVHSLPSSGRAAHPPLVLSLHDHSLNCANKRLMRGDDPCSGPGLAKCMQCAAGQYGYVKGAPTALALRLRRHRIRSAVDCFLPVSASVADRSGVGSGSVPFTVLPNFVPDEVFDASADGADEHDELPAGDFLLFVGDATPDKGIDVLLEAHRALDNAPPLVVIGRPLSAALEPAPANVAVLGSRSHDFVLQAARRATIAVVPSLCVETFGLVALEAMASGTPVVAARSGGLPELVVHEETGLITPPGEPAALAAALRRLLEDAPLRARMAAASRQRAESFREHEVIPRLERIYTETLLRAGAALVELAE